MTVLVLSISFDNFNSHAHVERDHLHPIATFIQKISTHTLTWSVTVLSSAITSTIYYFNSHAHVERDQLNSYLLCAKLNFNSHAHVERDYFS